MASPRSSLDLLPPLREAEPWIKYINNKLGKIYILKHYALIWQPSIYLEYLMEDIKNSDKIQSSALISNTNNFIT